VRRFQDGPDEDLTLAGLVGTGSATQFLLTTQSDAAVSIDLIAAGGALTLTVSAIGSFTGQQSPVGFDETFPGTVSVSGNVLALTDCENPADVPEVVASLSGNTLTLTSDDLELDCDVDDVGEPADLLAVLQWR
jgi:hypothetical protein